MRAIGATLALFALTASTPALAEMTPVEKFASWQLMKDGDPIFGDLGYRLDLPDTTSSGSTLSLYCTFEKTGTVSWGAELTTAGINFGGQASGGQFGSLLRFDEGAIRDADWIATGEHTVGYSSGGNNFIADQDNPAFKEAVRQGNAGLGGDLGEMLASGMLANGIQMFFWRATVSKQLAIGFETDSGRHSMSFDLSEGAIAVEKLLSSCDAGARASMPADTRSAREQAPWRSLETTNGEYKTIGLDPDQCLELHPTKHRAGDPLTVNDTENPSALLTATAGESDLVIDGPKQLIEVYFGENYTAGQFQYRTWTRAAATCAED